VDFGNGISRDFRIGDNGTADLALRFAHRFPSPGVYSVRVTGKTVIRGLRSATACEGGEKVLRVQVEGSQPLPSVMAAALASSGAAPRRSEDATAPSTPGTATEIEQLRADLTRLQEELKQQRNQVSGSSFPAHGPGGPWGNGSASSGSGGYGDVQGPPSRPGPDANCGPNPSTECAGRALVDSLFKLRELVRSRRASAAAGGTASGSSAYPGESGSPSPSNPAWEGASASAYPASSGSYAANLAGPQVGNPPGGAIPFSAPGAHTSPPGGGAFNLSEPSQPTASTALSCAPGRALGPREFAQPEYIGSPQGRTARMCFFRGDSRSPSELLNFYPNGTFVMSSTNAAGGVGRSGPVLGNARGTYAFQAGGSQLALRIAYPGTGVSQTIEGVGPSRRVESNTSPAHPPGRDLILPNCQRIQIQEVTRQTDLVMANTHPPFITVSGQRWEQQRMDCPTWQGWR
jgi:hypothetical protein